MATYDNPERVAYYCGALAEAAAQTLHFRGPAGKTGKVADVLMSCTTTMVDASGTGEIDVGPVGALTANCKWKIGARTAPVADSARFNNAIPSQGTRPNDSPYLVADTDFVVTWTAQSGSSAAGSGNFTVLVDWFD